jgi:hypothetical protein
MIATPITETISVPPPEAMNLRECTPPPENAVVRKRCYPTRPELGGINPPTAVDDVEPAAQGRFVVEFGTRDGSGICNGVRIGIGKRPGHRAATRRPSVASM